MARPTHEVEVHATCRWCGEIQVGLDELRCSARLAEDPGGLCEFRCPVCDRLVLRAVAAEESAMLLEAGARLLGGAIPFELLEERSGPPVSWDDVLDLRLALAGTRHPQVELTD